MYRGGVTTVLTGVPASTAGYHLAVARAADPRLESVHETAAAGKTPRVSARALERVRKLVAVVQETGRYPSPRAG
jgi:hypothetical protein